MATRRAAVPVKDFVSSVGISLSCSTSEHLEKSWNFSFNDMMSVVKGFFFFLNGSKGLSFIQMPFSHVQRNA